MSKNELLLIKTNLKQKEFSEFSTVKNIHSISHQILAF